MPPVLCDLQKNTFQQLRLNNIMANTQHLPLPGTQHGLRLVLTVIDERARSDPQSPWVSIPVDQENISKGYKDITAGQLANAVNYAAHWLSRNIPPSEPEDEFQVFAYVGPKDLRYPILAIAAGKLGKVVSNSYCWLSPFQLGLPSSIKFIRFCLLRRYERWFCHHQ